jgi:hypothetical protein
LSPGLPWHARIALAVCLALSGLVGSLSFREAAMLAGGLDRVEISVPADATATQRELAEKAWEAQRGALRGMRRSRVAVLTGQSLACALLFVTGLRLWRPLGISRAGMLKVGSATALACAVLRTVDGAQQAVVARRVMAAATRVMASSEEIATQAQDPRVVELASRALGGLGIALSIGLTVLVAGGFAALAQYLRSDLGRRSLAPESAGPTRPGGPTGS